MKSSRSVTWVCALVAMFASCGPSEQATARVATPVPPANANPTPEPTTTSPVSEPWKCNTTSDCDDERTELCQQTELLRKNFAKSGEVPPCRLTAACKGNQCDIALRIPEPPAPVHCIKDSDCAFKRSGCCGCGAEPVRADHAAAIHLHWAEACVNQACPAVIDERPICFTTPVCKNKVCSNSKPNRAASRPRYPQGGGE